MIRNAALVHLTALGIGLVFISTLAAQSSLQDPPQILKKQPGQKKDKKQESLKYFALGVLCEKEDRLLEALTAFEKAAQLDPESLAVQKKLLTFYVALDRGQDALAVCKKILELDPEDGRSWHLYAQQLNNQNQLPEAAAALQKGLKLVDVDDNPELAQQMYYDLGNLQFDSRQPLNAARSFAEAAHILKLTLKDFSLDDVQKKEIRSRMTALHERIGKIYTDAKKYDQASTAFQEAVKIDPLGGNRWHLNLAQIYQAQGKLTDALKSVDVYLQLQPMAVEAYELKIDLLKRLGRSGEVLPWLNQAAAKDRFNVNLQMLLAEQYARQKQSAQAEKIYLGLVKEYPKGEIYRKLLQMYRSSPGPGLLKAVDLINEKIDQVDGKEILVSDKAKMQVQAILSALKAEPDLTRELLQTALPLLNTAKDLNSQTVYVLAVLSEEHKDLKGAEAFYRAALKKVTPQTEAVVYGGLLRVLWKSKKYEDMVAVCKEGLRNAEATNLILMHRHLALAYARLGKMEDSLREAKKGIDLAPESSRISMQGLYISLLAQTRQHDKAEAEGKKLLTVYKQPGEIVQVRLYLASVYSSSRNFPKAENELQLVLKADPTNATAYNDLGYLWADQGKNLKEAEEMIRKALELDRDERMTLTNPHVDPDQDNAAFVDSLGWVLFRQGKLDEARQELERATRLPGGDDPVIWDHLGDVYYKLQQVQEAHQCWRKALELYENEKARPMDHHYKDLKEKVQLLKSTGS